ncbi:uncharacterized protein LOC134537724 [Bacillus rossius redtenbacheri]|uniref:uncharacterized protein LOC134537724 n=1 Tax=Bacillus rossius redtenbacheri TaxID=93214 RepID=UPI002FDECFA5
MAARQPQGDGDSARSLSDRLALLPWAAKVVELALSIFCIGLLVDPYNHGQVSNLNRIVVVYVAYCSYVIINSVLIAGRLARDVVPKRTMVMFTLVGCIMFFTAGAVVIDDWAWQRVQIINIKSKQYMDMTIASGVFAIFNAFLFFADMLLTVAYT